MAEGLLLYSRVSKESIKSFADIDTFSQALLENVYFPLRIDFFN